MATKKTFAQARGDILQTIEMIRNREVSASDGLAIFAGYRELHNSVQTEINAAKMALATEGRAHAFGRVVKMGQKLLCGEEEESA